MVHEYLMPLSGKEISFRESACVNFSCKLQNLPCKYPSPRNKRIIISLASALKNNSCCSALLTWRAGCIASHFTVWAWLKRTEQKCSSLYASRKYKILSNVHTITCNEIVSKRQRRCKFSQVKECLCSTPVFGSRCKSFWPACHLIISNTWRFLWILKSSQLLTQNKWEFPPSQTAQSGTFCHHCNGSAGAAFSAKLLQKTKRRVITKSLLAENGCLYLHTQRDGKIDVMSLICPSHSFYGRYLSQLSARWMIALQK